MKILDNELAIKGAESLELINNNDLRGVCSECYYSFHVALNYKHIIESLKTVLCPECAGKIITKKSWLRMLLEKVVQ